MKFLYLFLVYSLAVVAHVKAQLNQLDPVWMAQQHARTGISPLAAWYLNNNAVDSSGNGYNGTLVGSPIFDVGENGAANGAISLNGSPQYVNCPNIADNLTNFTITAWIKTTFIPATGFAPIITKVDSNEIGWAVFVDGADTGQFSGTAELDVLQGPNGIVGAYTVINIADGKWHSLVGTVQNGNTANPTVTIYLDGTLVGQNNTGAGTFSTGGYSNAANVQIGAGSAFAPLYNTADIDDVRIYASTLTSTQVTAIYTKSAQ